MSEFVFVCGDERSRDEGVELPTESDGNLLLAVLQSQFEGASGIKYKNAATGGWRAVKISDGVLCPPEGGWGSRSYVAVVTAGGSSKVDSEGGHEVFNAAPGGYNVPGSPVGFAGDSYKRKMEDQENGRAAKNPRSHSPDFASMQQGKEVNSEDLIILGLEWTVTDDELKKYFEQFGEVSHAEVKTDKDSSKSRGFGFVRFFSSEVQREVQTGEHCIKGRNVELKFPRKSVSYRPSKLFVGCLPLKPEVTTQELSEHFSPYGELTDVYIPSSYRGFGFVTFQNSEDAQKVVRSTHTLRKSTLNVTFADPRGSKNLPPQPPPPAQYSQTPPANFGVYQQYYNPHPYGGHQSYEYSAAAFAPRQALPGYAKVPQTPPQPGHDFTRPSYPQTQDANFQARPVANTQRSAQYSAPQGVAQAQYYAPQQTGMGTASGGGAGNQYGTGHGAQKGSGDARSVWQKY